MLTKICLVVCWVTLGFLISPNIVVAYANLSDNFDNNRLDPSKWFSFELGGPTITEVNNRLEINIPVDSSDPFGFIGEYVSACVLTGDYDIQVDYLLFDNVNYLKWPERNGVRMGISTGTPDEFASVGRVSCGVNDPSTSACSGDPEIYISEPNRNVIGTTDLSGKLKLTREGDISTSYYFDSGTDSWIEISSGAYTTKDVHLYIFAFSHDKPPEADAFGDQEVRVAFDNLIVEGKKICKGRFTPANPPLF